MNRILSDKEATALLSLEDKKRYSDDTKNQAWIDWKQLLFVVRSRVLEFTMKDARFKASFNDERGEVFIKPLDDLVPCGHFSYKRIETNAEI